MSQYLQETEVELAKSSGSSSNNAVIQQLLRQLNDAVVYNTANSNVETNRKLWDNYAKSWTKSQPWLVKMAAAVDMTDDLQSIGDEWAPREHTMRVIQDFIAPYVGLTSVVAEIGVGGGRIAVEVFNSVAQLHCYDISKEMLAKAQINIAQRNKINCSSAEEYGLSQLEDRVFFHHIPASQSHHQLGDKHQFDFIYSFDVFPHVDHHVLFQYLKEIQRTLKPGGLAFFSTSDITSDGGWDRFERQSTASVGGFCFTSPDIVRRMIAKAGLEIVKESSRDESTNIYYSRDYCVLVRK